MLTILLKLGCRSIRIFMIVVMFQVNLLCVSVNMLFLTIAPNKLMLFFAEPQSPLLVMTLWWWAVTLDWQAELPSSAASKQRCSRWRPTPWLRPQAAGLMCSPSIKTCKPDSQWVLGSDKQLAMGVQSENGLCQWPVEGKALWLPNWDHPSKLWMVYTCLVWTATVKCVQRISNNLWCCLLNFWNLV